MGSRRALAGGPFGIVKGREMNGFGKIKTTVASAQESLEELAERNLVTDEAVRVLSNQMKSIFESIDHTKTVQRTEVFAECVAADPDVMLLNNPNFVFFDALVLRTTLKKRIEMTGFNKNPIIYEIADPTDSTRIVSHDELAEFDSWAKTLVDRYLNSFEATLNRSGGFTSIGFVFVQLFLLYAHTPAVVSYVFQKLHERHATEIFVALLPMFTCTITLSRLLDPDDQRNTIIENLFKFDGNKVVGSYCDFALRVLEKNCCEDNINATTDDIRRGFFVFLFQNNNPSTEKQQVLEDYLLQEIGVTTRARSDTINHVLGHIDAAAAFGERAFFSYCGDQSSTRERFAAIRSMTPE